MFKKTIRAEQFVELTVIYPNGRKRVLGKAGYWKNPLRRAFEAIRLGLGIFFFNLSTRKIKGVN